MEYVRLDRGHGEMQDCAVFGRSQVTGVLIIV